MDPGVTPAVLASIDGLAREAVEVLQDLIRIPSVNGALAPDETPGGEARVTERLADLAGEAGLAVDAWSPKPGRGNVVAWSRRSGAGPTLLLGGHVDTVPAGDHAAWTHGGPYGGERADGRV